MSHCVYGSRTNHCCLLNTTTILYFDVATCLVIFGHHQAINTILQSKVQNVWKYRFRSWEHVKSYITENVIQKLLEHKAADSSQTAALVECVKYIDCWQIYTGRCQTLGWIGESDLETCCFSSEDEGDTDWMLRYLYCV